MPVREVNQDGALRGLNSADDLLLLLRGGSDPHLSSTSRNARQSLVRSSSGS